MNWKTFDVRYDNLLKRWKEHQELIDLEMAVSSRVEQLDSAAKLDEMLLKVEREWGAHNEHTEEIEARIIGKCLHLAYIIRSADDVFRISVRSIKKVDQSTELDTYV